jgi:hypothetical protein
MDHHRQQWSTLSQLVFVSDSDPHITIQRHRSRHTNDTNGDWRRSAAPIVTNGNLDIMAPTAPVAMQYTFNAVGWIVSGANGVNCENDNSFTPFYPRKYTLKCEYIQLYFICLSISIITLCVGVIYWSVFIKSWKNWHSEHEKIWLLLFRLTLDQ